MRLLAKLKTGEEGMIVGYAPGRKGMPMAIVLLDEKLRAVKLRNLEVSGFAKVRPRALTEFSKLGDDPLPKFH